MSCRPSSAHGPLGCSYPLAAVNSAAVNIPTHSDKYPVSTIWGIDRGVGLFQLVRFYSQLVSPVVPLPDRKPHELGSRQLQSPLRALPVPRIHPRGHVSICSNNKGVSQASKPEQGTSIHPPQSKATWRIPLHGLAIIPSSRDLIKHLLGPKSSNEARITQSRSHGPDNGLRGVPRPSGSQPSHRCTRISRLPLLPPLWPHSSPSCPWILPLAPPPQGPPSVGGAPPPNSHVVPSVAAFPSCSCLIFPASPPITLSRWTHTQAGAP